MYAILVYDIVMDEGGQRVLNRVFKLCKRYLIHVQRSVFEGELSESQLARLKVDLCSYIRSDRDSVIVFLSRVSDWQYKEFWGKVEDKTSTII